MAAVENLPPLQVITKTSGKGRPKQPLAKRKALSDNPHKNRKGPPDVEIAPSAGPPDLPVEPPVKLSKDERECWDMIVSTQTARNTRWLYRSDCSFLLASCSIYGRWMEIKREIDALRDCGEPILDPDTGKANPLYNLEVNTIVKYQTSLRDLGLVPSRRQITLVPKDDGESPDDGLLR